MPSGTKSPIRIVGGILGGIFLLAAGTWTVSFVYWHWRLRSAIRDWEQSFASNIAYRDLLTLQGKTDVLYTAGCRSLPDLVEAVNSSADPKLQRNAMIRILDILSQCRGSPDVFWSLEQWRDWSTLDCEAPAFGREKRIAEFNRRWKENGRRYHHWWKTWSSRCCGD